MIFTGGVAVGTSIVGGIYGANRFYKSACENCAPISEKIIDSSIGAIRGLSAGFIFGTLGTMAAPITLPILSIYMVRDHLKKA